MRQIRFGVWASFILVALVQAVNAQGGRVFQDTANGFSVGLPGDWKAVTYNDAVGRQRTEFVYRDRSEGLLRVSGISVGGRSITEIARDEMQGAQAYRQAFEQGNTEAFGGGALRGVRMNFFYIEGGHKVAETDYFLKDGDRVWELRFTGKRGVLDLIRNLTDEIARSFKPGQ